jgi:4-amino-4-deoxy-L-arabinose transferase-like glycosyltransferase
MSVNLQTPKITQETPGTKSIRQNPDDLGVAGTAPSGKGTPGNVSAWWAPLAIFVLFAASALFINPLGDFPVNDDWIYGKAAQSLAQTGKLDMIASCASCFLHIYLGAFACKMFGASYSVLRILTLAIAFVGSLSLYGALRELRLKAPVALVGALIFAFNPLFMNLAYSYMTDVAALSFNNLYFYLLLKAMRTNSKALEWTSGLVLVASIAIRQTAVVLVAANACLLLFSWCKRKPSINLLLSLIILPLAATKGLSYWMSMSTEFVEGFSWYQDQFALVIKQLLHAPLKMVLPFTFSLGQLACYVGLFCAPLLVCFVPSLKELFARAGLQLKAAKIGAFWYALAAFIVTAGVVQAMAVYNRLMPFNQNLLRMPNVGASTIMGISIAPVSASFRQWLTLSSSLLGFFFVAIMGACLERTIRLIAKVFRKNNTSSLETSSLEKSTYYVRAKQAILVMGALVFSTGFLMLQMQILDLDRYYLMAVAPAVLALGLTWSWLGAKLNKLVSFSLVAVMLFYSVAATQDYMAWNRARWEALVALEKTGVSSREIDGGSEYNFVRDLSLSRSMDLGPGKHQINNRGAKPRSDWRWWPINGEKYIVSFSTIPDYDVIDKVTYWSALSFKTHEIFVLQQVDKDPSKFTEEIKY